MITQYCDKPDRDAPLMKCGYPLPCPHHTVVLERNVLLIPKRVRISQRTKDRLLEIGKVVK